MISTLNNLRETPLQARSASKHVLLPMGRLTRTDASVTTGDSRADLWGRKGPEQRLEVSSPDRRHLSPQQQLQLCLPLPLQLQLLLDGLLHPRSIGQGLLPPGQVLALVLVLLLQERLQDTLVRLLQGGAGSAVGALRRPQPSCPSPRLPQHPLSALSTDGKHS